MSFATLDPDETASDLAEINMVPLIDVMLVLLVIFIVAAPLLQHAVPLDLPRAASQPQQAPAESIKLAIDRAGHIYWNGTLTPLAQIEQRLTDTGTRAPHTELHLSADSATAYERVAQLLAASSRAGLTRVGFVTDPRAPPMSAPH